MRTTRSSWRKGERAAIRHWLWGPITAVAVTVTWVKLAASDAAVSCRPQYPQWHP